MFPDQHSLSAPPLERLLLGIDTGARGAVIRTIFGFLVAALYEALFSPSVSLLGLSLFLLLSMLGLRLFGIAIRRVVRFSEATLEIWALRRKLAKYFDSYQWQKLTWIGVGLLLYTSSMARGRADYLALALFCIVAGTIGIVIWRRNAADDSLPKPAPRFRKVLLDRTPRPANAAASKMGS